MNFFRNYFLLLMILSMIVIPALTASVSAQTSKEKKETQQVVKKETKKDTKSYKKEPWIEVRATPILGLDVLPVWHLYIVYHSTDDKIYYYRGGPTTSLSPVITTKWGEYKPGTVDYDLTSPSITVMKGKDAENKMSCFQKELNSIKKKKIPYNAASNSNSVAYTLLVNCEVPVSMPKDLYAPGWRTLLQTDSVVQTSEKFKEVLKDAKNEQKKTDNKNTVKSDPNNKSTQDNKKVLQQLRVKTTSISSEPKDSITNYVLAEAYSFLKQGKYQDAIFYYEQVIRGFPTNSAILNNLAMAYYNLGDYEKALKYYNAIESNSNNKVTQDDKEAIQEKTKKQENEQKKTDNKNTVKSDPNNKFTQENEQKNKEIKDLHDKAWALRDKGKYQEAIKIYEQILDIDRKNFSALWRLGACYLALGDYENAREYYDDALDIDHKDTYVLTMLGYIYEKLGNYDKAMKYYNTSIVIDPNYKYAQDLKKALEQKIKTPKTSITESPQIHVRSGTCTVNQVCEILIATATGGSPPYYFENRLANGAPPMGMIVDLNGYLTGTPSREGTYNVGVCVVDLVAKSSCDQVTVTVNPVDDIIIEPDITAPGNSARDLTGDWEGTLWVHVTYSSSDLSIDCQYTYQLTLHLTHHNLDGSQGGWYATGTGTGTGHNGKYDCIPAEERGAINFTIFGSEYSGTMGYGPVKGSFTTDQINGNSIQEGGDGIETFKFSATRQ